jgi:signal transduction histidine kinase
MDVTSHPGLESPATVRLSSRMRSARLASGLVPTPLSVAGYLIWALVALELWHSRNVSALLRTPQHRWVATLCMISFLFGFGARAKAFRQRADSAFNLSSLAVTTVSALVLLSLGPSGATPALLVVIAAMVGAMYRPAVAVAILGALNIAFLAELITRWHFDGLSFTFLVYGTFQAFALLTTSARVRAERISAELRDVNAQLLATRELLAEAARDGERLRVSRELHDVAGHRLTALALNLEVLGCTGEVSERRAWQVSRGLVAELLTDLRSVVANLRRNDGIDAREALRRIADAFPSPQIHLNFTERIRIDTAERADAIVRAGQEGITNAVRHARARNIWVSLTQNNEAVHLEVRDDGACKNPGRIGNGLRGMQERVESLGGRVEADGSPEGGYRLHVMVPAAPRS